MVRFTLADDLAAAQMTTAAASDGMIRRPTDRYPADHNRAFTQCVRRSLWYECITQVWVELTTQPPRPLSRDDQRVS
jgi:hypothetical protein